MKKISVFMFIDALGWKIIKDRDFLKDHLPNRYRVPSLAETAFSIQGARLGIHISFQMEAFVNYGGSPTLTNFIPLKCSSRLPRG